VGREGTPSKGYPDFSEDTPSHAAALPTILTDLTDVSIAIHRRRAGVPHAHDVGPCVVVLGQTTGMLPQL